MHGNTKHDFFHEGIGMERRFIKLNTRVFLVLFYIIINRLINPLDCFFIDEGRDVALDRNLEP